jgi:hypothetical protein
MVTRLILGMQLGFSAHTHTHSSSVSSFLRERGTADDARHSVLVPSVQRDIFQPHSDMKVHVNVVRICYFYSSHKYLGKL